MSACLVYPELTSSTRIEVHCYHLVLFQVAAVHEDVHEGLRRRPVQALEAHFVDERHKLPAGHRASSVKLRK